MLNSIHTELYLRRSEIKEEVETIYFGGGTPSLLSSEEIKFMLDLIKQHYKVVADPEITLEGNPDDLSKDKITSLADSGVNRLSIGIQSFFEEDLRYMNRAHSAYEAKQCLDEASRYFDNISIDLIYGIPGLSEARWIENLKQTVDHGIGHISSYALTVESKTALDHFIKSGKYKPLDDALAQRHFKILQDISKRNDYVQYELSNFGKEGFFSRHNTSYWKGTSYLGIGPSAHSYDGKCRSWNFANNAKYIAAIQQDVLPSEKEALEVEDRINESIMTGLRTIWGVSLDEIEKNFGELYKNKILHTAAKYLDQGTLNLEKGKLFLRPEYYFLADGISADLFLLKV